MSIFDSAVSAFEGNSTLQQEVKDVLYEPELTSSKKEELIVGAVGKFKDWSEDKIDPSDRNARKRVNNIINDISRICREHGGFAVRCKSRKGGYKYVAVDNDAILPRKTVKIAPPPTPDPLVSDTMIEKCVAEAPIATMMEYFKHYDKSELSEIMKAAHEALFDK